MLLIYLLSLKQNILIFNRLRKVEVVPNSTVCFFLIKWLSYKWPARGHIVIQQINIGIF